ncbi:hypothetical protein G7046_g4396 [Stylonectria norvegica]|nr:hypothetical protein G7046_g4396 [Stylonectria norvegica]
MASADPFIPALIVVDFQEDFCPPVGDLDFLTSQTACTAVLFCRSYPPESDQKQQNLKGSLAVPQGRAIASTVNHLLTLPFTLKIATKDWHPPSHTSFAPNHPSAQPYTSTTTIQHPTNPSRSYITTLWPIHCVQGSPGAALVPELDVGLVDRVLEKGMDPALEMYSAFYDPFRVCDTGLAERLREEAVTDVFVVGLAGDYCVKATAEHAVQEGYRTFIVSEGTRPVMPDRWDECQREMQAKGIKMVSQDGAEVARVKELKQRES